MFYFLMSGIVILLVYRLGYFFGERAALREAMRVLQSLRFEIDSLEDDDWNDAMDKVVATESNEE